MTLSSADLEFMRSEIENMLPDTCNILSVLKTSDGMGGFTETWGTATANVKCRLDTKSGNYRSLDGSVQSFDKLVFSLPYNTAIEIANRIEYNGETYQPTAENSGSWLAVKRVEVEKL